MKVVVVAVILVTAHFVQGQTEVKPGVLPGTEEPGLIESILKRFDFIILLCSPPEKPMAQTHCHVTRTKKNENGEEVHIEVATATMEGGSLAIKSESMMDGDEDDPTDITIKTSLHTGNDGCENMLELKLTNGVNMETTVVKKDVVIDLMEPEKTKGVEVINQTMTCGIDGVHDSISRFTEAKKMFENLQLNTGRDNPPTSADSQSASKRPGSITRAASFKPASHSEP